MSIYYLNEMDRHSGRYSGGDGESFQKIIGYIVRPSFCGKG